MRYSFLLAVALVGCCAEHLGEVERGKLLQRITDLGEVGAAARPDLAGPIRSQTATLRSDVDARLR